MFFGGTIRFNASCSCIFNPSAGPELGEDVVKCGLQGLGIRVYLGRALGFRVQGLDFEIYAGPHMDKSGQIETNPDK